MAEKPIEIQLKTETFDPNASKYMTCCCHVKNYTIISGVVEIFVACFFLVAAIPDLNSRLCDLNNNSSMISNISSPTSFTLEELRDINFFNERVCDMNVPCLIWVIVQIMSINVMFYGIKSQFFLLFLPHILIRLLCASIFVFFDAWIIYVLTGGGIEVGPFITTLIFLTFSVVLILHATLTEVFCCHFIKRSKDTGFSISVAQPFVRPTTTASQGENPTPAPPPPPPPKPLRGMLASMRKPRNGNQYVVEDTTEDKNTS